MTLADITAMYDGDWFDCLTALGAFAFMIANRFRVTGRPFWCPETGLDFINGLSLVPLLFIAASVVSTRALTDVVQHSRLSLCGGAIVAICAVLKKV